MQPLNSKRSAAVGLVAWLVFLLRPTADTASTELIHRIVLFGVMVIVPWGLSLVPPSERSGFNFWLYNIAVALQSLPVPLTVISFYLDKGILAGSLVCGTLVVYSVIALYGVSRLISRRSLFPIAELSIDAGLIYLPVAGAWLLIYRLGIQPFGFGEIIILLTAVHFHFAGFATPILAGMNGRVLSTKNYPRPIFAFSVFAIVAAMPLVAAGNYIIAGGWFSRNTASLHRACSTRRANDWLGHTHHYQSSQTNPPNHRSTLQLLGNGAGESLRLQSCHTHFNSHDSEDGDDARNSECLWFCHVQSLCLVTNYSQRPDEPERSATTPAACVINSVPFCTCLVLKVPLWTNLGLPNSPNFYLPGETATKRHWRALRRSFTPNSTGLLNVT